mgnify:FL=1|tara:strand:+ start:221 stop:760 length:540 start_codon:yes stop_codon:yes gene_type:complete
MDINKHAYFAGGCFWCTEAIYKNLKGVIGVFPGYSGGKTKNPSYKEVCTGETGHAETVKVVYDPSIISYELLLEIFFATHDPTTLNRQGNDVGSHYRSVIFFDNPNEKNIAEKYINILNKEIYLNSNIVTEVVKFDNFYEAEDYHWNYFNLNKAQPYCSIVISPKIQKFKKNYNDKLKL